MTMELWCPFADFAPVRGHDHTGPMAGDHAKIVHHTTEGDKIGGAEATYEQTGNLPHFTDTFEFGHYEVHQHLPLDQYATALKHPAGLGETDRDHAVQIEHVGFTASSNTWADGFLDGIAILCRWIEAQTGCMRVSIAPFVPGARRLTWPEWHGASGHCGHMHVPFNDHVDPGAMNIAHILTAGQPVPGPAPVPIPPMEADGMNVTTEYHPSNAPLDPNGHGWIVVPHDFAAVVGLVPQGPNPPADGYWPPVHIEAQPHEGETLVCFYGQPGQQTGVFVKVLTP